MDSDCLTAYTGLESVFSLELHASQNMFLCGFHNGSIRGYRLDNGDTAIELVAHSAVVKCLVVEPESAPKVSVIAHEEEVDDETLVHRTRNWQPLHHKETPSEEKSLRAFSASADGTVRVWNLGSSECVQVLKGHGGSVNKVLHNTESNSLITVGDDGCVKYWTLSDGRCTRTIRAHTCKIEGIVQGPSENLLVTCSGDGLCKVIDIEKGALNAVFEGCSPVKCITTVPSEETTLVCAGCSDGRVRVFDLRTANCISTLAGHKEVVFDIKGHKQHLFSSGDDSQIIMWNLTTMTQDYVYKGHTDGVRCLVVSKDGTIFSGGFDKTVRLWDRDGVLEKIKIMKLLSNSSVDPSTAKFRSITETIFNKIAPPGSEKVRKKKKRPSSAATSTSASTARPSSASISRPTSATSRASSISPRRYGADKKKKELTRTQWEPQLSIYNEGNMSGIHKVLVKYCQENGQLSADEYGRGLQFLGVSAIPLLEQVYNKYKGKGGSIFYPSFIKDLSQQFNSREAILSCFQLWDVNRCGGIPKKHVYTPSTINDDNNPHKLARNELQGRCLVELFDSGDESKLVISMNEFIESMQTKPKFIQAFLTPLLLSIPF